MRTGRIIGPTSNAEGVADPSTTPSISLVEVIPALLADREGVPKDDPWPFLDPYGYSQGKLLFGRQHERDAIKRTLSTLHAGVFVIHGASGTGKSSLVNAVIVNELVALGFRVFVDQIFKRRLVAPTNTFTEWKRIATRGEKVAIILDQFEELFVLNEKRLISEFMASMAEIVGKLSLPLIIGVRREFYSDVVGGLELHDIGYKSLHIPRLTLDGAAQALQQPATTIGVSFEDGLISIILKDLASHYTSGGGEDGFEVDPPQLQVAIDTLYRALRGDASRPTVFTHRLYLEVGGAAGAIKRFFADRLGDYSSRYLVIARSLLKRMVSDRGTKKPLTALDLADLKARFGENDLRTVLHRLVGDRLIRELTDEVTTDERPTADQQYELAHDYLVASISAWIDERERSLRVLNSQLEKYYPLLDLKNAKAPLPKNLYNSYLSELKEEANHNPGWIDSITSTSLEVLLASGLQSGSREEVAWVISNPELSAHVSTAEIIMIICAFGGSRSLLAKLDAVKMLSDDALLRSIQLSVEHGGDPLAYWCSEARSKAAVGRIVSDTLSSDGISPKIYQRCRLLEGVFTGIWNIDDFRDPRYIGTVLDELRLFTGDKRVFEATSGIRGALLRQCVAIPEGYLEAGTEKEGIRIHVPSFLIGHTPVTNGQYREFVEAGGYSVPQVVRSHWTEMGQKWLAQTAATSPDVRFWRSPMFNGSDQPVVGVCLHEAMAYASFVGGRLPTEHEWERAARGNDRRVYPWGDAAGPEYCVMESLGETPTPVEVARFPKGRSPFGIYDLSGNVWEWTSSKSEAPDNYILRGGSMQLNQGVGKCGSRSHREAHDRYYFRGFRVAWNVDFART